jgi:hypothetical protein
MMTMDTLTGNSSAALNALKRHQLVSLSKRYGLKASGKNVDLIERLQARTSSLPLIPPIHTRRIYDTAPDGRDWALCPCIVQLTGQTH